MLEKISPKLPLSEYLVSDYSILTSVVHEDF